MIRTPSIPVPCSKKKDTPTGVFLFGAALLLRKLRVAVVRRTAFDNVGDVDLGAVQINHLEHVVEQLSGRADIHPPFNITHKKGIRVQHLSADAALKCPQTPQNVFPRYFGAKTTWHFRLPCCARYCMYVHKKRLFFLSDSYQAGAFVPAKEFFISAENKM